jgi:hypothetical protein
MQKKFWNKLRNPKGFISIVIIDSHFYKCVGKLNLFFCEDLNAESKTFP